jgi:hypothetical protein
MYIKPHGHTTEEERKAWIDVGRWIKFRAVVSWNRLRGRTVAATPVFDDGYDDSELSIKLNPEVFETQMTVDMLLLFGSGARRVQLHEDGDIIVTYHNGSQRIYIPAELLK